jgi:hypothetical protein
MDSTGGFQKTMYTLNQQSQFCNRLVTTITTAKWSVRTEAASLNNLRFNQPISHIYESKKTEAVQEQGAEKHIWA